MAEFLVAKAVGAHGPRLEWDAYDVLAPDRTRIEVKSSVEHLFRPVQSMRSIDR